MRLIGLGFLLAAIAAPAAAQDSYPPADSARIAAVEQMAQAACVPEALVPPMEMVGGSAGSGKLCRLANSVQPRISRVVARSVTGAAGTATVTWSAMSVTPGLLVQPYVTSTDTAPPSCYPVIGTVTTTGATIKCYFDQTLLGLGLLPRKPAAANITFDVIALPPS